MEIVGKLVGKLVGTDTGAIWTIAQSEVMKMRKSEKGTFFHSDHPFRTDSGFRFGLGLFNVECCEAWSVRLVNVGEVTVNLYCTVIIQQEWELDVKVSGLTGGKAAGFQVAQLLAVTKRGLVVEVRVGSCEQDTAGGAFKLSASSWRAVAATKGAVTPNKGTVAPNKGTVTPNKGTVAPNKGTVAPNKGAVAPTKREVDAKEAAWTLEKALEYVGEETTEEVKKSKKTSKKEKRKQKLQKSKLIEKNSKLKEGSEEDEDTDKEEEQRREKREKIESLKMKLMLDEEELKGIDIELSQSRKQVEELVEEQRRSRRREELPGGRLAEEVRSREAMERELMEQVAEEEGRGRRLEEQLRQEARVSQTSPRLLEAATRPGAAHSKEEQEEQEARVAPSSRNLGAIPKTRAATTKQTSFKMPGASSPPSSKAQKSVERMARLLEERGRLASLPTPSLRHLVAQLRARLGGLSDLSLGYVEKEVARMAGEEAE